MIFCGTQIYSNCFIPRDHLKCMFFCLESFHPFGHQSNFKHYFQTIKNLNWRLWQTLVILRKWCEAKCKNVRISSCSAFCPEDTATETATSCCWHYRFVELRKGNPVFIRLSHNQNTDKLSKVSDFLEPYFLLLVSFRGVCSSDFIKEFLW